MVNTRRKSHVQLIEDSSSQTGDQSDSSTASAVRRSSRRQSQLPKTDDSNLQAAELSDSSTTSTSRRSTRRQSQVQTVEESHILIPEQLNSPAKRLTRRSVGNLQAPKEFDTPTRRSRRLSNSSVESVNNDTPRPATRRSTRNKPAASDDDVSDIELVCIKRKKLVESVDTLIPICEEKNESEQMCQIIEKEESFVIQLEEDDEVIESSKSAAPSNGNQILVDKEEKVSAISNSKLLASPKVTLDQEKSLTINESKATLNDNDSIQPLTNTEQTEEIHILSPSRSPLKNHVKSPKNKAVKPEELENDIPVETAKPSSENIKCALTNKVDTVINSDESSEKKENFTNQTSEMQSEEKENPQVSSQQHETINVKSPVEKVVQKQPQVLFGIPAHLLQINGKPLENKPDTTLLNKVNKKRRKKQKNKKQSISNDGAKVAKPTELPCGAEIMRNIPRGKSKSGREWKPPKSNPRYLYKDKGLKMPLEKITQLRQERQRAKELENRLKEEERARRIELARRRELNKKREEENARRGEIVQVIRNPNKLKRMKKKQLKLIQKRDTTGLV